jgi:gliding motility-associated-like protein
MTLNNGLGDVAVKNEPLYGNAGEKMAYTYQKEGNGYWLVVHVTNRTNLFVAFAVTANGISTTPIKTEIGRFINDGDHGIMRISRDGKYVAFAGYDDNFNGYIQIADFNGCDGTISNPRIIKAYDAIGFYYGVEFSPNNKLLYVSNHTYQDTTGGIRRAINAALYQYKIASTKDSMLQSEYVRVLPIDSGTSMGNAIQLGPDGAIYWCLDPFDYLAKIPFPDSAGPTSGIQIRAVYLKPDYTIRNPKKSEIGLPTDILPPRRASPQVPPTFSKTNGCAKDSVTLNTGLGTAGFISWVVTLNDAAVQVPQPPPPSYKLLLDSGKVKVKLTYAKLCSVDSLVSTFVIPGCPKPPPPPPLPDSVFIPNIFTPGNGDTLNRAFRIRGNNILSLAGSIYNRWGKPVFTLQDNETGWEGKDALPGIYFYQLTVSFTSGKSLSKKGWVELVR